MIEDSAGTANGIATERPNEPQLAELLSNTAGSTGEYQLKVRCSDLIDYSYIWNGKEVKTQKLQLELQSHIPEQYCLGIAKLKSGDKKELEQMHVRFKKDSTWKLTKVKLMDDKPAFIHTVPHCNCFAQDTFPGRVTERVVSAEAHPHMHHRRCATVEANATF